MSVNLPPIPYDTPIEQDGKNQISIPWYLWLSEFQTRVESSAEGLDSVNLTNQSASISATPIVVTETEGLFRVSWYLRITTAATTNSSATVTIGWTETGVSLTESGPAETGNTTTSSQSGTFLIRSDAAAAITYAVAYSSTGATAMRYRLDVVVERVE
jgi:hypothetical protein